MHGLASDHASLHKPGKDDRDRFQLHLNQLMINAFGETAASNVSTQIHTIDGADLCRVHVRPSNFPVEAEVVVDRKGQFEKRIAFYIRVGNGTREIIDQAERLKSIAQRWSKP